MTDKSATIATQQRPKPIPRACSDVFRIWAAFGLGILLAIAFELAVEAFQAMGLRKELTAAQRAIEEDFGSDLIAWLGFATAYLWLGIRAFAGCDHEELRRRIRGSPLPRSRLKRFVLAGGGGIGWAILISLWAFATVIRAVINRRDVPVLTLSLAGLTVLSCIAIITFSFAVQYARKDVDHTGLDFAGNDDPVFSDYLYLAVGCSVTFGTTDTSVIGNSMRRTVMVQSVLAWILNTVVIAVMLSLFIN